MKIEEVQQDLNELKKREAVLMAEIHENRGAQKACRHFIGKLTDANNEPAPEPVAQS